MKGSSFFNKICRTTAEASRKRSESFRSQLAPKVMARIEWAAQSGATNTTFGATRLVGQNARDCVTELKKMDEFRGFTIYHDDARGLVEGSVTIFWDDSVCDKE
jgi:hypothetical protein